MKKLIPFVLLGAIILGSCTKNTTQVLPGAPAFVVNGLQDITIAPGSTHTIPFTIQYQDSTQQTVTVTVSGIPAGFENNDYTTSTKNGDILATGIPTFSASMSLTDSAKTIYPYPTNGVVATGTYPITITCTGSLSGAKTYTFNIKVTN